MRRRNIAVGIVAKLELHAELDREPHDANHTNATHVHSAVHLIVPKMGEAMHSLLHLRAKMYVSRLSACVRVFSSDELKCVHKYLYLQACHDGSNFDS